MTMADVEASEMTEKSKENLSAGKRQCYGL